MADDYEEGPAPSGKEKESDDKSLTPNDWSLIAHWIKDQVETRKAAERRRELETIWTEVDRQISMKPLPRKAEDGDDKDWYPDLELPLQFDTLEVNCADARRLKFPRGTEWYSVSSNLSDEYLERWSKRRENTPLIGGSPAQIKLDKETADILTKASMDYFHRLYDFRSQVDLLDVEAFKYGTYVGRIREVVIHSFHHEYRGVRAKSLTGPALIPCSIRTTLLDDTPIAVAHEGIRLAPGHIRFGRKHCEDIKKAIAAGGPERGWRQQALKKIEPEKGNKEKYIDYYEYEGDLLVPRNRGEPIFLPACEVMVAVSGGGPEVIRFRTRDFSFMSYIVGHYMKDDVMSPYGVSPLMKGQSLQEAATGCLNDIMATGALNARPPCFWDRQDPSLAGKGGPSVFPGSKTASDSPDAVQFMERADVAALVNAYLAILKQYEDMTNVNDPRRSGTTQSHTTAYAADLQNTRGLSRVTDYVAGQEEGPLTSMLYMEYEIVKKVLKRPRAINVDQPGIDGWANIAAADLPDEVAFKVHGSQGVINERQQAQDFAQAVNMALQIAGIAAQLGQPVAMQFAEITMEIFRKAGVQNAGKFIGATTDNSANEGQPGVQGSVAGLPANTVAAISRAAGA